MTTITDEQVEAALMAQHAAKNQQDGRVWKWDNDQWTLRERDDLRASMRAALEAAEGARGKGIEPQGDLRMARDMQELMTANNAMLEIVEDARKALPVLRTLLESAGLAAGVIVAEGMIARIRALESKP